ncbi:MAG: DNA/RNA nuclease SfsA [Bacteroidetes bacterium HGW-Bacteroidetes-4]|jgi:sugar fermentation stimulation protein A|nr:MAG: DNA/RNA nuclease SfsA [Bacteroidetes bacterium HGW-Bacteroidetes-4]
MHFSTPLIHGKLIKRYKRFLADVLLDNGETVVAHCTNSGTMLSCLETGADVYLTPVSDPKRKTRFTWEMIRINQNWVGVNTGWPNVLAYEAIKKQEIEKLKGYLLVKREVKFNDSRFDIYCENSQEKCFVEVKNVTLKDGNMALFPDAVTTRGQKHLKTLIEGKKQGYRAVMLYIIQRSDVVGFTPARKIDPDYALALELAINNGVEVIAIQAKVTPQCIVLKHELPTQI